MFNAVQMIPSLKVYSFDLDVTIQVSIIPIAFEIYSQIRDSIIIKNDLFNKR